MDNNILSKIPSLRKNTALKYLLLGNNRLQSSSAWPLPGDLPDSLKFIRLAHNQLVDAAPTWVQRLPYLEYLDVSGNNITSLITKDIGASSEKAAVNVHVGQGGLGRNDSLLLVGGNPVCEAAMGGTRGNGAWGTAGRWHVRCESQCSDTCPHSIPWKKVGREVKSWLGNGKCNVECNSTACGFDGGDCL